MPSLVQTQCHHREALATVHIRVTAPLASHPALQKHGDHIQGTAVAVCVTEHSGCQAAGRDIILLPSNSCSVVTAPVSGPLPVGSAGSAEGFRGRCLPEPRGPAGTQGGHPRGTSCNPMALLTAEGPARFA